jgi:hypothetical protein
MRDMLYMLMQSENYESSQSIRYKAGPLSARFKTRARAFSKHFGRRAEALDRYDF